MSEIKKPEEITKEKQDIYDDMKLILKCQNLEQISITHRRKFDWEWLVRTLYVRGYHYAAYNRGTNTIVFSTRTGVRIPINLVAAHLRGVRNQVTSFQPKWEVLPNVTTEDAFQNARYSGKVLDYIYDEAQIKRKIKEVVTDALMYSIGIWQFDVDDEGNIIILRCDPFDVFVDPNVKSPNLNDPIYGAEYVIFANQTSIDAIKKNPEFKNTDQLQTDNLTAAAEYKRFLLQVSKNLFMTQKEQNQTVILYQAYLRERQLNGEIKIRVVTYTKNMNRPLKNELLDDDEYPFEVLQGDIHPGDLYGVGWIKHLIPINRVIDALESHIFEYNHFFARGKWVIDKNSGVRLIVNQHGQILEKNRGAQVQAVTVPPLPPSPMQQIANMKGYLEDISGVHDASLGRLPPNARSGVAIAELKQSDATNQGDLVDNLEDFLARAGRKILKLCAKNWTTSKLISVTGLGGKPDYFMAIGEVAKNRMKGKNKFKMGDRELPLAVIGAQNKVRVQVGSWLAYTKEARLEKLKELFRLGAIDQKTLLEHLEFADIDGIYNRSREERIFSANAGTKSQDVQKQYGVELDEESLALAENELMNEGTPQHAEAGDDHQIHLMVHKEDGDIELVKEHIAEHLRYQKWKNKMESRPMQPVNPMEAGQPVPTPPMGGAPMGAGQQPEQPMTFPMQPPVGPGAPPFNPNQPVINPTG